MFEDEVLLGRNEGNTHRTLQELVSVNAWFVQDHETPTRLTLHADVSFLEQRVTGGETTEITFKVAIKRCDIIFRLPSGSEFRVDPSTVQQPKPLDPKKVLETKSAKGAISGRAQLSLKPRLDAISGELSASAEKAVERTEQFEQNVDHYHEIWKKVRGGHHAWQVDGRDLADGRLAGPVLDGTKNPRLTIVDQRSEESRRRDLDHSLAPTASIVVRCYREDVDIYDVNYKNPSKQSLFERKKGKNEKLVAAVAVLKEALLKEGLVAGDIESDPFAEMSVCDVSIEIADNRA